MAKVNSLWGLAGLKERSVLNGKRVSLFHRDKSFWVTPSLLSRQKSGVYLVHSVRSLL